MNYDRTPGPDEMPDKATALPVEQEVARQAFSGRDTDSASRAQREIDLDAEGPSHPQPNRPEPRGDGVDASDASQAEPGVGEKFKEGGLLPQVEEIDVSRPDSEAAEVGAKNPSTDYSRQGMALPELTQTPQPTDSPAPGQPDSGPGSAPVADSGETPGVTSNNEDLPGQVDALLNKHLPDTRRWDKFTGEDFPRHGPVKDVDDPLPASKKWDQFRGEDFPRFGPVKDDDEPLPANTVDTYEHTEPAVLEDVGYPSLGPVRDVDETSSASSRWHGFSSEESPRGADHAPDETSPVEVAEAAEHADSQPLHWEMSVGSAPETRYPVINSIGQRLEVHDIEPNSDEKVPEGATEFEYSTEAGSKSRDVHFIPQLKILGLGEGSTRIGEYLENGSPQSTEWLRDEIAMDYLAKHPDLNNQWWLNLDAADDRVVGRVFRDTLPNEQIIAGKDGHGIRFFNFSRPMDEERQADCVKFVDFMTQYFGDNAFDYVQDVVIANFKPKPQENPEADYIDVDTGFAKKMLPGVIFINAELLHDFNQPTDPEITEGGTFLETMIHEAAHRFHGYEKADMDQLLEFAREVGWDVDAMLARYPGLDWVNKQPNLEEFAPPVARKDAAQLEQRGSPSLYGKKNPLETFAETQTYAMLGDFVLRHMPEIHGAWLDYIEKHTGRPIASPLNTETHQRTPIVSEMRRRTEKGNDILYPKTQLPDKIDIYAKRVA